MLSHLYSYVFGSENEEECSSTNLRTRIMKEDDDGWQIVKETQSGRTSPILIGNPQLIELEDDVSCHSNHGPSPSSIRKAEILREAKAANRMRLNLEKAMFADPPEKIMEPKAETRVGAKLSGTKLKRASVSSIVNSETKIKNRSKKSGMLLSGVNNNRKCNNLV